MLSLLQITTSLSSICVFMLVISIFGNIIYSILKNLSRKPIKENNLIIELYISLGIGLSFYLGIETLFLIVWNLNYFTQFYLFLIIDVIYLIYIRKNILKHLNELYLFIDSHKDKFLIYFLIIFGVIYFYFGEILIPRLIREGMPQGDSRFWFRLAKYILVNGELDYVHVYHRTMGYPIIQSGIMQIFQINGNEFTIDYHVMYANFIFLNDFIIVIITLGLGIIAYQLFSKSKIKYLLIFSSMLSFYVTKGIWNRMTASVPSELNLLLLFTLIISFTSKTKHNLIYGIILSGMLLTHVYNFIVFTPAFIICFVFSYLSKKEFKYLYDKNTNIFYRFYKLIYSNILGILYFGISIYLLLYLMTEKAPWFFTYYESWFNYDFSLHLNYDLLQILQDIYEFSTKIFDLLFPIDENKLGDEIHSIGTEESILFSYAIRNNLRNLMIFSFLGILIPTKCIVSTQSEKRIINFIKVFWLIQFLIYYMDYIYYGLSIEIPEIENLFNSWFISFRQRIYYYMFFPSIIMFLISIQAIYNLITINIRKCKANQKKIVKINRIYSFIVILLLFNTQSAHYISIEAKVPSTYDYVDPLIDFREELNKEFLEKGFTKYNLYITEDKIVGNIGKMLFASDLYCKNVRLDKSLSDFIYKLNNEGIKYNFIILGKNNPHWQYIQDHYENYGSLYKNESSIMIIKVY